MILPFHLTLTGKLIVIFVEVITSQCGVCWVGLVWGSSGSVYWYFDEIANKPIPKSHVSKSKIPKVPWFKQAIKERKKAQRKLHHNPTAENVLAFEELKAKTRHVIKNQNKTSWQNLCTSLSSQTKPKTVWKAIRKIKGKSILPLKLLKS